MKKLLKIIFFGLSCFTLGWITSYSYFHAKIKSDWKPKHCLKIFSTNHKIDQVLRQDRQRESAEIEKIIIIFKDADAEKKFVCTYNDRSEVWGAKEEK